MILEVQLLFCHFCVINYWHCKQFCITNGIPSAHFQTTKGVFTFWTVEHKLHTTLGIGICYWTTNGIPSATFTPLKVCSDQTHRHIARNNILLGKYRALLAKFKGLEPKNTEISPKTTHRVLAFSATERTELSHRLLKPPNPLSKKKWDKTSGSSVLAAALVFHTLLWDPVGPPSI